MAEPIYATGQDVANTAMNANALASIPGGINGTTMAAALSAASRRIDSYLRDQYKLPLLAWGDDIRACCAEIAAYYVMRARGFNPASGADKLIKSGYEDQLGWLKDISDGRVTPDVQDSEPGSVQDGSKALGAARITTSQQRGWFPNDPDDPSGGPRF